MEYPLNDLTDKVIGAAIHVYLKTDTNLPESAYQECLLYSLPQKRLLVEKEKGIPVTFDGIQNPGNYTIGLLLNFNVTLKKRGIKRIIN
ncbi:MAG TPA: hypothetical protein DEQ34_03955 [Balneolaceae bacterium]|nr:hypothetical protein [Balneolaceae bacterium]|tara:strand:+ start:4052 stop:4318 length:267 start_codon:yes stop_codon:yes gene_type:complete